MSSIKKQLGLSLVEIMVALALSAVLATALYRIVLGNQQGMMMTESYAKTQEAARTAFDMLQYDLRMAGYRGCAHTSSNITSLLNSAGGNYSTFLHDFSVSIAGINNYSSGVIPGNKTPVAGSDIFISRGAIPTDLILAEDIPANANNFTVAGPLAQFESLKAGHVMMVSDCENADIFAVSAVQSQTPPLIRHEASVTGGPSNVDYKLTRQYVRGSQVLLLNTVVYFIAESTLIPGINSLYRYESLDGNGADAKELVPYIEDMQLTYSVDVDGDGVPDEYRQSDAIADMSETVHAIRIDLKVATENNCELVDANINTCLQPQNYQRLVYIRNSGRRS